MWEIETRASCLRGRQELLALICIPSLHDLFNTPSLSWTWLSSQHWGSRRTTNSRLSAVGRKTCLNLKNQMGVGIELNSSMPAFMPKAQSSLSRATHTSTKELCFGAGCGDACPESQYLGGWGRGHPKLLGYSNVGDCGLKLNKNNFCVWRLRAEDINDDMWQSGQSKPLYAIRRSFTKLGGDSVRGGWGGAATGGYLRGSQLTGYPDQNGLWPHLWEIMGTVLTCT